MRNRGGKGYLAQRATMTRLMRDQRPVGQKKGARPYQPKHELWPVPTYDPLDIPRAYMGPSGAFHEVEIEADE